MCSFSSARTLILALSIQVFGAFLPLAPIHAQDFQATESSTAATTDADSILPRTKEPAHPLLPERNIPTLPMVPSATSGSNNLPVKAPLAWRQKSLNLSMDKFKTNPPTPGSLTRCISAGYSDCIAALTSSCASLNYKVEHLNSNAGELLVSSADAKIRLVFCLWEQGSAKTWVAAGVERGKGAAALKNLSEILDATANTLTRRGRI